jgi:hypothetical protein
MAFLEPPILVPISGLSHRSGRWMRWRYYLCDLEVKYSGWWVPKLDLKLTRTLWYTLGTARGFDRKQPCNRGLPAKSLSRTAVKSGLKYPRGHPYRALDQRSSLRSSGSLGPYFTHRGSNMRYIHVLDLRGEDGNRGRVGGEIAWPKGYGLPGPKVTEGGDPMTRSAGHHLGEVAKHQST